MGRVVLDTGALIGWERGSALARGHIERARRDNHELVVPVGVVAQYWRGGAGSQVPVARLLKGCDVHPFLADDARAVGTVLKLAGTDDVIDATVAMLAGTCFGVVTSDPRDINHLLDVISPPSPPRILVV